MEVKYPHHHKKLCDVKETRNYSELKGRNTTQVQMDILEENLVLYEHVEGLGKRSG